MSPAPSEERVSPSAATTTTHQQPILFSRQSPSSATTLKPSYSSTTSNGASVATPFANAKPAARAAKKTPAASNSQGPHESTSGASSPRSEAVSTEEEKRLGVSRRKSSTMSRTWNWAYSMNQEVVSPLDDACCLRFDVLKTHENVLARLNGPSPRVLTLSLKDRALILSSSTKPSGHHRVPLSRVSRLAAVDGKTLRIEAHLISSKETCWMRTLEFSTIEDCQMFSWIARGLNAWGTSLASVHASAALLAPECKLTGRALQPLLSGEPTLPSPLVDLDGVVDLAAFCSWFARVTNEAGPALVEAETLLRRLEAAVEDLQRRRDEEEASEARGERNPSQPNSSINAGHPGIRRASSLHRVPSDGGVVSASLGTASPVWIPFEDEASDETKRDALVLRRTRLLPLERLEMEDVNVSLLFPLANKGGIAIPVIGALALTSLRLGFVAYRSSFASVDEETGECFLASPVFGRRPYRAGGYSYVNIALSSIKNVRAVKRDESCVLELESRFGALTRLRFDRSPAWIEELCSKIKNSARGLATKPSGMELISTRGREAREAWFDAAAEFARQGALAEARFTLVRNEASSSSQEYCATYPTSLLLPSGFVVDEATSMTLLKNMKKYRSRARFPVVTWVHPTNGAVLARSAQPSAGLTKKRNSLDERLVEALSSTSRKGAKWGISIVDARGVVAVAGNQIAKGKGAEDPYKYKHSNLVFMGVGNIHTMRASHEKLVKAGRLAAEPDAPSDSSWLKAVAGSAWVDHVRRIVLASIRVAETIQLESTSVLVHCSDGWDRTAQICALAQILLDPYFRTLHGLSVLIEKDWIGFGHKFADRCLGRKGEHEISPVFAQFLDALHQLMSATRADAFEYNEAALVSLRDAAYNRVSATFAFNSSKERTKAGGDASAAAFWEAFCDARAHANPAFEPPKPSDSPVLWIEAAPQDVSLWKPGHWTHVQARA